MRYKFCVKDLGLLSTKIGIRTRMRNKEIQGKKSPEVMK